VIFKTKGIAKKELLSVIFLAFLTLSLFLLKNFIISGYPLYPLNLFTINDLSWKLPDEMLSYIVQTTNASGFQLSVEEYKTKHQIEQFVIWINLPGLDGYFNKLMVFLLIIFPIIIYLNKERESLIMIYFISFFQFVLLQLTSPQYRFFLGFMIILSLIIFAQVLKKRDSLINISMLFSLTIIFIPIFFGLELTNLTNNESHSRMDPFESTYLIKPHPKSKYKDAIFESVDLDGNEFFTPKNIDFFWATGDCPLPCIQMDQYNYFKYYHHVIPALRTTKINLSGF